jgi:cytoskeletal protein CcmA (bactofilin family)
MNNLKIKKGERGQMLLLAIIIFLAISLSVVFGIARPLASHIRASANYSTSLQSMAAAEALNEEILYRLNEGETLPATLTLNLNNSSSTATISDIGGTKQITSQGTANSLVRTVRMVVQKGDGISFNYGMHAGNGGVVMANNSVVIGNIYSNGNISGGQVTGTAVAANSLAISTDQTNSSPLPPTQLINFATGTVRDFAQSFELSTSSPANKVEFYIKKTGIPSNATVRITNDSGGSPGATTIDTATLNSGQVTTEFGWIQAVFTGNTNLNSGTTYWLVIDYGSPSGANFYTIAANSNGYASGQAKTGTFGSTWTATSPVGLDGYFNLYIGGFPSSISNVAVSQDAWAHTITGGSVGGTKYCQSGSGCNTTRSDPSPVALPISDAMINQWKLEAEAGGTINGNYVVASSTLLGPIKINGDLTINSTLTLTGAIWVTGAITVNNNQTVRLSPSFGSNSGMMIADGKITILNNAQFIGSGQANTYILLLTTANSGGYDLDISNNAASVVLYAANGTLHFNNNAGANEATAYKIVMENNAEVRYLSGLANQNFSTGPSGSWNIVSWSEIAE